MTKKTAVNGHKLNTYAQAPIIASKDAERAVLGCIAIDQAAYLEVSEEINADDFYFESNKVVYQAITDLFLRDSQIDIITISEALRKSGKLGVAGGEGEIFGLMNAVPTSLNAVDYAHIVKEKALRRRMIAAATGIANLALDEREPIESQLSKSDNLVFKIRGEDDTKTLSNPEETADRYLEFVKNRQEGRRNGYTTGIKELDGILMGIDTGLYLVAGNTGEGKSTLLRNICLHFSRRLSLKCLYFSMEMSKTQLMNEFTASVQEINNEHIKEARRLAPAQMEKIKEFSRWFGSDSHIYIDENSNPTPSEMRATIKRQIIRNGLDAVFVDYDELVRTDALIRDPNVRIAEITRQMKIMSSDFNVPFIVAKQFNRSRYNRNDKRPQISDLNRAGERDANVILAIHHPAKFDDMLDSSIVQIGVIKNREGRTGWAAVFWQPHYGRFINLSSVAIKL